LLTEKSLAVVLEAFGYAGDDEAVRDLTDDLRQLAATHRTVGMVTGALASAPPAPTPESPSSSMDAPRYARSF
jgi:hypothetical protein